MPTKEYCDFVDKVCGLAKISEPSSMYERAVIQIDGVRFIFHEDDTVNQHEAAIYVDFGPLPEGPERERVTHRLLDMNLTYFQYTMPYYVVDSATDHVYLVARVPVQVEKAKNFLEGFAVFAEQAKEWRKTYFLHEPADETPGTRKGMSLQERMMKRAGIG